MKHPLTVEKYDGSLEELAEDLGNLRYDALNTFLEKLLVKMEKDAMADHKRGRKQLAQHLRGVAHGLTVASDETEKAWKISEPHMK